MKDVKEDGLGFAWIGLDLDRRFHDLLPWLDEFEEVAE